MLGALEVVDRWGSTGVTSCGAARGGGLAGAEGNLTTVESLQQSGSYL